MNFNLFVIMSSVIALCYWLEENTKWIAHISGLILIIIIASALGGAGLISSALDSYSWSFKWMVPLGVSFMLLAFNPKDLMKIEKQFIFCFILGSLATVLGGLIAGYLFKNLLPNDYWRISGQLTASFIGGYENAVSVGTGLQTPAPVFVQAFAGDSILTTLWIMAGIFQGRGLTGSGAVAEKKESNQVSGFNLTSIAITSATACLVLFFSRLLEQFCPSLSLIVWVSLLSTLLTFTALKARFVNSYVFGSLVLSYFIFGCGAISNMRELLHNASFLLLFPAVIVLIHAAILFSLAKLFKLKKEIVIITSQCLIGGPATALAVVAARKWDYQLEAIALGLLGYALGNYFGFGVAYILH